MVNALPVVSGSLLVCSFKEQILYLRKNPKQNGEQILLGINTIIVCPLEGFFSLLDWLVVCLGFNDSLSPYFLHQIISQKDGVIFYFA